jgi:hypothetical protein
MGVKIVDNTAFLVISKASFNVPEGIRRGLHDVGPEIKREVKRLIKSTPKTGSIYNIGGKRHQASAPGESPANLSGDLVRSLSFNVSSATRLIIGERRKIAPYAAYLEEGSPHGRIKPRPHLRPAVISKAREIEQAIQRGISRELGKVHR